MTVKSYSRWSRRLVKTSLGLLLAALSFWACNEDPTPSLYQPENLNTLAAPVIASVDPAGAAFAGIGVITINGQNFSSTKTDNKVYFNDLTGEILEASATQLKVRAPNLVSDNVNLKITIARVEKFSNVISYKLVAAVEPVLKFAEIDEPWGIASDAEGNLYFSLVSSNVGAGVKKLTPAGEITDYSPKPPGLPAKYSALKVGPTGVLYGATIERRILQIPPGGGAATTWASTGLGTIYDFDFDADLNIWAGGNNNFIYRVKPDKSVKPFAFKGNVRSVRVFNGYVYVAAKTDSLESVWRFPLQAGGEIGPEEKYFDFSALYRPNGPGVFAITFAADGDLYLGTDAPEAILVVHPDKTVEPLYAGLFSPKSLVFAWGKDTELFMTRENIGGASQTVIRINMQKASAPYYGRP